MTQSHRIGGGQIDRNTVLKFRWNDRWLAGHPGDTLASALMANGEKVVGRSFKYHRPRGIFSAGSEEPNALVTLGRGARSEPNTRATVTELFNGLIATSQNHRGSLGFDLLAANDLLSPFLSAGFYYKTFMWPRAFWERFYEPAIRAAAGLGRLSGQPDPDSYDHGTRHCDLLVIGAGPAGLAAALTAGRAGARVILADEDFRMGGRLNAETRMLGEVTGADWAASAVAELAALPNVRLMPRTTVFGAYDHGIHGALERMTDHLGGVAGKPRQVLWHIYATRSLLCAGATERSMAFGMNDRPGIMLAGAVRAYVNRWGVAPGREVAVFTNNDDGLRTAADLRAAGIDVVAVLDARKGDAVVTTVGRKGLKAITLADGRVLPCDCLAVSGGWSPNVHLTCHHRGRPVWSEAIAGFVPGRDLPPGMAVAGAANGTLTLAAGMAEAREAARAISADLGHSGAVGDLPEAQDEDAGIADIFHVKASRRRAWIDLQNDVTVKDVKQSLREGFRAVEHVKRYTTLGMATDQGKTANVLGLAVMAEAAGRSIAETGTTIFRPPYTPVPIGAFAGRTRGTAFRPTRLTPAHGWAEAAGASFTESGLWMRAEWFARAGEAGWRDSVDREVRAVRTGVGICDVSTLGKIELRGRDVGEFLNRVYSNAFAKLAVGRVRYGLMLREDGFAYDDGTCARLADDHYVMTTTTANAGLVMQNLEFARQCLWPDLDVHLVSTTDAWAQFAVAGPKSRALLARVVDDLDLSNEAFPFMACTACTVFGGTPARLFRISFSGELAYELAVPARYGASLAEGLMQAGADLDVTPYGLEALNVMRIEKGHPTGAEINGQSSAQMLGLGGMLSASKDFVGAPLGREGVAGDLRLVGFRPVDRGAQLVAGAHFLDRGAKAETGNDLGWMTSVAYSPSLDHMIGLGFLKHGADRIGDRVIAWSAVRGTPVEVEVCSPHFIDPEGDRQRG